MKYFVKLEGISIGLSQNPDTKDYVLVHNKQYFEKYCEKCGNEYTDEIYKWCKPCQVNLLNNLINKIDENKQIYNFILKEQLKINSPDDFVFEWIPYVQFNCIEEVRKGFTTAVWKNGLLKYNRHSKKYERKQNEKVALKYLYNLKSNSYEYINKIKSEDISYGISQDPETKEYILIFHGDYFKKCCENCGEKYHNSFEIENKRCKSCQHHENEKINDFIQEQQLKVNYESGGSGILFEWIPYNQFHDIKKIGKGGFSTVYSAIWKNGPLHYNFNKNKLWKKGPLHYSFNKNKWWMRESNKKVALKC
ncbi:unnamed protein product [Rhizophagus irregularis]|nr:unnamed protein product [Rhizophagus irregularis]